MAQAYGPALTQSNFSILSIFCLINNKKRLFCSARLVHKYIDKRIMSHYETYSECDNVIDTKHNKLNFDRLNLMPFLSLKKSTCSEKLLKICFQLTKIVQ